MRANFLAGNRLLLDTNILLDALIPDRPQSSEACRVLELCNGGGDMGFACSLSLKDVYYVMQRHYGETQARTCVDTLAGLICVAPVGVEECDMSLRGNEPDFEDGLVRACAELNDIDFILTRDKDAFQRCKIRTVTCAEYLTIRTEQDHPWRSW